MNLLLVSLGLMAQWPRLAGPADPHDHLSPDGALRLHVESVERDGDGPGIYTMFRGDQRLWRVEAPFHLGELFVTEGGQAFGYGNSVVEDRGSEMVVAVIGADGGLLLDERTPKTWSGFMHMPHNPLPLGLVPDPAHDRIWVRIADPDINAKVESWWGYRLSTGERLGAIQPGKALGGNGGFEGRKLRLSQAAAVPGTDLILVQWRLDDRRGGDSFALLTVEGKLAWRLGLPLDDGVEPEGGGKKAEEELGRLLKGQELILGVSADGQFEVGLVKTKERVTFGAGFADGAWSVEELVRAPWSPKAQPGPSVAGPERVEVELELLGTTAFQDVTLGEAGLLQDAQAWCIDGKGHLAMVTEHPTGGFERLRRDLHSGESERVRLPSLGPVPEGVAHSRVSWFDLGEDQWLASRRTYRAGVDDAWLIDAKRGTIKALTGLRAADRQSVRPAVKDAARLGNGALAMLVTYQFGNSQGEALLCLDPDGELQWVIDSDYRDPAKIFSPRAMTVVNGDLVVVLESDEFKLYGADGRYQRTVNLAAAWGQAPNYPTGLRPDGRGGLLVHDFGGNPSDWRMDLTAGTSTPLAVAFADGRKPEQILRNLRAAPGGGLWTTDGFELLELDASGAVVRFHEAPPDPKRLYDFGPARVFGNGRISLQDQRTGALHSWDEEGARRALGLLPPEECDRLLGYNVLRSGPGGETWAQLNAEMAPDDKEDAVFDSWVHWHADGTYLGRSGLDDFRSVAAIGERVWAWTYHGVVRVFDRKGTAVGRIDQAPDKSWLAAIQDVSAAPDGRTWIWERPRGSGLEDDPVTGRIFVCGADAKVEELLTLTMGHKAMAISEPQQVGPWILPSHHAPLLLTMPSPGNWKVWEPVGLGRAQERGTELSFGLSADGTELLVVDGTLTLRRYALPDPAGD